MKSYVLDTSAILAYTGNEDGSDIVEQYLLQAFDYKLILYVSVISIIEVYYTALQKFGVEIANSRFELLNSLPIIITNIEIINVKSIGNLKANYRISFADSCIAGLASEKQAILVHKDPEFEPITTIKQLILPYKNKKK